jgi:hypothetical protein
MRRFLTLICLLCLAIPAGISISGCTRDPGANYCNGLGYGMKIGDVSVLTLQPTTTGISMAYGQTRQLNSPTPVNCKGDSVSAMAYSYGTTNNQLVDISPTGNLCAGTWNRNSTGGVPNYSICSPPNPLPSIGGLPYATVSVTASANGVTSNAVTVNVHALVTSVSLVTNSQVANPLTGISAQCYSQGTQTVLDAQACYTGANNHSYLLCAPSSVTSANSACDMPPGITPGIIASGTFGAPPVFTGSITGAEYVSGGTITGAAGKTCVVNGFNNGLTGATATIFLTGANTIASGTALNISAGGSGASLPPTTATLSNGTATCSGTATIVTGPILGTAGQTCNLNYFNNGSSGATATVALTGTNTIAIGTPLTVIAGGINATAPPTTAILSNGTATCSGTASVGTPTTPLVMTPVPNCTASIGTFGYSLGAPAVASITTDTTTNQVTLTAAQPGTTSITASLAGSGSSAGYFSTCPPASISVTLANGGTAGTITRGVTQNLTTTVTDTQGHTITGLTLDYQSTDPIDISATSSGGITTSFPGVASVYAICQSGSCNPAPINEIGLFGTGLPLSSNKVTITTPGTASNYAWFAAPGQSQYVFPVELLTGTIGSSARLPYVPNSMVMDRLGDTIYFGSSHELITFNTISSSVTSQNTAIPGVVLAASPDGNTLLINDQVRQLFYIYSPSSSSATTFGGMGSAASWTPDSKTLYITDSASLGAGHSDTLYVYNQNTGWATHTLACSVYNATTCPLPSVGARSLAITIPSVGAYLSGSPTVAHTWCPTGTVGNYASMTFYPQSDWVAAQTDVLAATTDGKHILGAALGGGEIWLSDIGVTIPTTQCAVTTTGVAPNQVQHLLTPLSTNPSFSMYVPIIPLNGPAAAINQVVPSPASNLAFITYTGSTIGPLLPYYVPGTGGAVGTVGIVPLTTQPGGTAPTASVAGAFTPDNKLFFVSTAGDNKIHYINIPSVISPSTPPTDTQQISPNLPACSPTDFGCTYTGSGTIVPATVIVVKPRSTT